MKNYTQTLNFIKQEWFKISIVLIFILLLFLFPKLIGSIMGTSLLLIIGYLVYNEENVYRKYIGIIVMFFGILAILGSLIPTLIK